MPESSTPLLRPLTSGSTYRCGVYLLLGAVILLPYVLLTAIRVKDALNRTHCQKASFTHGGSGLPG